MNPATLHPTSRKKARLVRRIRGFLALAAALVVLTLEPFGVGAQNQQRGPTAQDPGQSGPRIKVDVRLALVEATAKDKSGKVIPNLQQDDFVVYEDGVEQKIGHFSQDKLPLAVAVVVDLSGSIRNFLRPLRYATLTAVKTLKDEDQVALFTFNEDVYQNVGLTYDKRTVADQMEHITAGGGTNINDALYDAARYLKREAPAARRVIILVSDNRPSGVVHHSHDDVRQAALEADAVVYGLKIPGENLGSGINLGGVLERRKINVERLTGETGGEVFDIEKVGSLYLAFQELIDRLKTRYTIGYYPTNRAEDGGFRKIRVRLAPRWGNEGSDYAILAKQGYYANR